MKRENNQSSHRKAPHPLYTCKLTPASKTVITLMAHSFENLTPTTKEFADTVNSM